MKKQRFGATIIFPEGLEDTPIKVYINLKVGDSSFSHLLLINLKENKIIVNPAFWNGSSSVHRNYLIRLIFFSTPTWFNFISSIKLIIFDAHYRQGRKWLSKAGGQEFKFSVLFLINQSRHGSAMTISSTKTLIFYWAFFVHLRQKS